MTLAPISIAGAGNWLLAHDRIGPQVLERAAGRYGPEVELCELGSRGLGLLDLLRGQELLLVVDACLFGGAPGEIHVVDPDLDAAGGEGGAVSVHQIGPLEALYVARELYPEQLPRTIRLVLVETEGLTRTKEEATCTRVLQALDREVQAWRAQERQPPM